MTNQIKIFFDLIAGILAGLQVLIPKSVYEKIDKYLIGGLQNTVTPRGSLRWLWIIIAVVLAIAVILMLEFSNMKKDISNGHITQTVTLIIGFISGMIVLALITRFYGVIKSLRDAKPTDVGFWAGLILAILFWAAGIILVGQVSSAIFAFIVAFSASLVIMGTLSGMMPIARWFLTFQNDVLLRIGVISFIIARVIELKIG